MSEYILKKRYTNYYGLDLASNDLVRAENYATDMLNAQYRKNNSIEKRKGYQASGSSKGGLGLYNYDRVASGLPVSELLVADGSLWKVSNVSLVITYSGADPTILISHFFDTDDSVYRFEIQEGTLMALNQDVGVGFDEAAPVTITQLSAAINLIPNFSSAITGDGSVSAAFLKVTRNAEISGGVYMFTAKYSTEVNKTVTTPFALGLSHFNDANFELMSSSQLSNIILLSNGYDEVHKYDGQTVYRAGLPTPGSVSQALGAAGAITGTNYYYKAQYLFFDNTGNFTEANVTTTAAGVSPTAQSIDVTVSNIVAGTGFNTNCAIIDGAQVSVNIIAVDNGSGGSHTIKVGDTAYFYDSVSVGYVVRLVTAVSASTISVAGLAVTVADNAVVSNNLRIGIYRNPTSGSVPSIFFVVAEIPNNSFSATQVYNDNLTDAQLNAEFIPPITDRSTPPKGKYISSFRNQVIISGNTNEPNTVYFSDIDGPEYFPNIGTNQFDVLSQQGTYITGIAPNNEVFAIFQNRGIHIVSGDIANLNIRVDTISNDVGCASHHSIQEVRGTLYFLSPQGPRKMVGGQLPEPLGRALDDPNSKSSRIDPFLDQNGIAEYNTFNLRKSIGFHDRSGEKYWLLLAVETVTAGSVFTNANSVVMAYDYTKDAWLKWGTLNFSGGICIHNDEVYFKERAYSDFNTALEFKLLKQMSMDDAWDYQDNTGAISFSYSNQWEALGEPSVLKRFLSLRLFSLEDVLNNALMLTVKTEADYVAGATKANFSYDFSADGYGASEYGNEPYGDTFALVQKHKLSNGRFRALRAIFENQRPQENVLITGWELEIAAPYKQAFKT